MRKLRRITAVFLAIAMVTLLMPVSASLTGVTVDESIDGWKLQSTKSDSGVVIDQSAGVRGKASARIFNNTASGTGGNALFLREDITVKKNKNYCLEFEAKSENTEKVQVWIHNTAKVNLVPVTNTYDWTTYRLKYRSTVSGKIGVYFILEGKTDGWWLDNVRFYDVEKPDVNLIQNGDFENFSVGNQGVQVESAEKEEFNVYSKTMTVDGKLDDWAGVEVYDIGLKYEMLAVPYEETDTNIQFAYDEDNFYFAIQAIDNTHYTVDPSSYWNGDSVQFNLVGVTDAPMGTERGIIYYEDAGETVKKGLNFEAVATRNGNVTIYEVSVPWSDAFQGVVPPKFPFNAIVNNNDGNGRVYCMEITPGISNGKDPSKFNDITIWRELGGIHYSIDAPQEMNGTDDGVIDVYLKNDSEKTVTAEVFIDELDYQETFTLDAGTMLETAISLEKLQIGKNAINMGIKANGQEHQIEKEITVHYTAETYPLLEEKIAEYISDLKALLLQCEHKGLTLDYEVAYYSLLCSFEQTMKLAAESDYYKSMGEFEEELTKLYESTKKTLQSYLSGEAEPIAVPKYLTSEIKFDEGTMFAKTDTNGVEEERPILLNGFGHFDTAVENIPFYQTIGVNAIQLDVNLAKTYRPYDPNILPDWTLNRNKSDTAVVELTQETARSGKQSLKITREKGYTAGKYTYLHYKADVNPNTTYEYGLYAKGAVNAGVWYGVKKVTMEDVHPITSSNDWVKYTSEYKTGDLEGYLDFVICIENEADPVFIDDIFLKEKGTEDNLLKNADIEKIPEPMNEVEKEAAEMGLYFDRTVFDKMRARLEFAEDNNIYVDIPFSHHTWHMDFWKLDPEMTELSTSFVPFVPDNKTVRKIIKIWNRLILDVVSDYDCVQSLLIINEPQIYPYQTDHYLPDWHAYLKNLYGTVERMNEQYGSNYQSFEEVPAQSVPEGTPVYYDYWQFSSRILGDHIKWILEDARSVNPNLKYHTKTMNYIHPYAKDWLKNCTNYEYYAEDVDINGCDSIVTWGSGWASFNASQAIKWGWYDYMYSLNPVPVWDTEAHAIQDLPEINYDDMIPHWTSSELWNGAFHHRQTSIMWVWDLDEFATPWGKQSHYLNSNYAFRPASAVELTKTMLDMQRLSKEITAVNEKESEVGILYSRTSLVYTDELADSALETYAEIIYNGQRPGYVTDATPEDMHKYKLLVVPDATNIKADMLEHLKTYIENGGEILVLGDGVFGHNEYNKPHDPELVNYILENSDTTSTITEKIAEMKMTDVILLDAVTGEKVDGVEWAYIEHEGKMLVNMSNYDKKNSKTVKIVYQGEEVKSFTELRSNEMMNESITVHPFQPQFISFEI